MEKHEQILEEFNGKQNDRNLLTLIAEKESELEKAQSEKKQCEDKYEHFHSILSKAIARARVIGEEIWNIDHNESILSGLKRYKQAFNLSKKRAITDFILTIPFIAAFLSIDHLFGKVLFAGMGAAVILTTTVDLVSNYRQVNKYNKELGIDNKTDLEEFERNLALEKEKLNDEKQHLGIKELKETCDKHSTIFLEKHEVVSKFEREISKLCSIRDALGEKVNNNDQILEAVADIPKEEWQRELSKKQQ